VQILNHIVVSGLRLNFSISEEDRIVARIAGKKGTRLSSRSCMDALVIARGETETCPPFSISKQVRPPNARH
jgi:hypothetical protein